MEEILRAFLCFDHSFPQCGIVIDQDWQIQNFWTSTFVGQADKWIQCFTGIDRRVCCISYQQLSRIECGIECLSKFVTLLVHFLFKSATYWFEYCQKGGEVTSMDKL